MTQLIKTTLWLTTIAVVSACHSDDSSPGPGPISAISITESSVSRPYPDDSFTLTGTGFDPDITKDTVVWGRTVEGTFYPSEEEGLRYHIKSGTATTLLVEANDPQQVDSYLHNDTEVGFRVRASGRVSNVFPLNFKRLVYFSPQYGSINTPLKPDLPFVLYGRSFTGNCSTHMTITRCQSNTQCNAGEFSKCDCDVASNVVCDTGWDIKLSTNGVSDQLTATIPLSVFGELHNGCPFEDRQYQTRMKITNGDGKSFEGFVWISYRICK